PQAAHRRGHGAGNDESGGGLRRRKDLPMAVEESSTLSDMARLALAQREPAPVPGAAKPARRLPVQKDWPTWALITAQVGILVGAISLWEIGARAGWIDAFFWSQPSAIAHTLTIFFTTGDAWTDIS